MGTPNSDTKFDPLAMLHQVLISGRPLDHDQLIVAGIDIAYLHAKHENIKPQLPYIDGCYFAIEEYFIGSGLNEEWRQLVADKGLTGHQCLSFSNRTATQAIPYGPKSILSIQSLEVGTRQHFSVEVFLLRDGRFVSCCGVAMDISHSVLATHRSADGLCQWLRGFMGETHRIESEVATPFPIVLGDKIDSFLEISLAEKARRKEKQQEFRNKSRQLSERIRFYR